jgi:hypothetical protein
MYLSGRNEKMSKMTAAERKEAKEWSEASERIRTREGWEIYQNARLAGSSPYLQPLRRASRISSRHHSAGLK